jgi:beta-lactamase superfamily II metal-dependent hydrolase
MLVSCGGDDPDPDASSGDNNGSGSGNGSGQTTTDAQAKTGTLPAWQEGYLDIHFINTTYGESAFYILPDGTQMLIDAAGSLANTGKTEIMARWLPSIRSSQIIIKYIKKCMEWTGNNTIDYAIVTHFHNDHMGTMSSSTVPMSTHGSYRVNGMLEVLDSLPVAKIFDRGYPDYDYPYDLSNTALDSSVPNSANHLRRCIEWHKNNTGLKQEKFQVGSNSQLVLLKKPEDYGSTFQIRNIFCNGEGWIGSGTATKMYFPVASECSGNGREVTDMCPQENHCSIVIKLTYGNFDLYSGGDNTNTGRTTEGMEWKAAEWWVKDVVGDVDVMKANHHGVSGANGQDLLSALNPAVAVINSWQDLHPRTDVYNRYASSKTYGGKTKIFITNLASAQEATFTNPENIAGSNGHVVIRVNPRGNSYYVYVLEDGDDPNMKIKTSIGPIACK